MLWHDQIRMCVKERPWKVLGQVRVIVICTTNIHSHRKPFNRLQEVIHCWSSKLQPLALETNNARVRRDTGSRRGVLVRQEEETLHRNVGRVLG